MKAKLIYHPTAWKALSDWRESSSKLEQMIASIVENEIEALADARGKAGSAHPNEKSLGANIDVRCLKLYVSVGGNKLSLRIYFIVQDGAIWILDLLEKRRTRLNSTEMKRLRNRERWARSLARDMEKLKGEKK